MDRPQLLDLFCGAGGAGEGYHRAGFDVLGVDIVPQPHYPHRFVQGDALDYLDRHGHEFDAVHASPPCQDWTQTPGPVHGTAWLLPATRAALEAWGGGPWVIENVPGAAMRPDYLLCGCLFGLALRRVRQFETSWHGFALQAPHHHTGHVVSVVGRGTPTWVRHKLGYNPTLAHYRAAMGIDWMTREELSQAIPPAYTEFVGGQLLDELAARLPGPGPVLRHGGPRKSGGHRRFTGAPRPSTTDLHSEDLAVTPAYDPAPTRRGNDAPGVPLSCQGAPTA